MSICLLFSNFIISFKIFNYENKSKLSRSNKLSCFKYFSKIYNLMTLIFNTKLKIKNYLHIF